MAFAATDTDEAGWPIRCLPARSATSSASHPMSARWALLDGPDLIRNQADVIHHLYLLHGRLPGLVDLAIERSPVETSTWMISAAVAFAEERAFLTRLRSGPPRRCPARRARAECEAAVLAQRHALEMLATSERAGCATGAALAMMLDLGQVLRGVLDIAASGWARLPTLQRAGRRCDRRFCGAYPPDAGARSQLRRRSTVPATARALGSSRMPGTGAPLTRPFQLPACAGKVAATGRA